MNRIVVLLTPLFAALAGAAASWLAENFPGSPQIDETQLTALIVAAATSALAMAAKWLHGWQKHEERRDKLEELALRRDLDALSLEQLRVRGLGPAD